MRGVKCSRIFAGAIPALALLGAFLVLPALAARPLALHPDNPHYFLLRGKPTVLITSGEHYGAVLNLDFDFAKYLDTLARDGLNLTRTFAGAYCEPAAPSTSPATRWRRRRAASSARGRAATSPATPTAATSST